MSHDLTECNTTIVMWPDLLKPSLLQFRVDFNKSILLMMPRPVHERKLPRAWISSFTCEKFHTSFELERTSPELVPIQFGGGGARDEKCLVVLESDGLLVKPLLPFDLAMKKLQTRLLFFWGRKRLDDWESDCLLVEPLLPFEIEMRRHWIQNQSVNLRERKRLIMKMKQHPLQNRLLNLRERGRLDDLNFCLQDAYSWKEYVHLCFHLIIGFLSVNVWDLFQKCGRW